MNFLIKSFTTIILFIVCYNDSIAKDAGPTVASEPGWITKRTITYNKTSLDKLASDGYIEMNFENQVNLADQSEYFRICKKILSQSGVQNASQISISFNPEFQQLIFHSIRIIRNNNSIDKLKLSNIKTVQQEEDLNNFIYNGTKDAILILDDIRPGDFIEYSYTIKGYNPIFKNKYSDWFRFNYEAPLYDLYYKIVVPSGRKMNFKSFNSAPPAKPSTENGQQVYQWTKNDIQPLKLQDYTPSWYDPYEQIQVSEYENWKEVNDWSLELFPANKPLSPAVKNKIAEIEKSSSDDESKIKTALRFVQDDIRYMGIETGVNSHKPSDPSKVFSQRFGDCKEKSYLLCCMLNALHIEAAPVLINTSDVKQIANYLPSPTNFNHVTVRVKLGDDFYYFDPTIAFQRGKLKDIFYPDYQVGLVITPNTEGLTEIKYRKISEVNVQEYFKVNDMSEGGILTVTSTFKGEDADNIRETFHNSSIQELMTDYQKFYAVYYDDIRADSLNYIDNDSTGVFTTKEYYSLSTFWIENNGVKKFDIDLYNINSIIRKIQDKQRTMPFSLPFPTNIKESITVDLPRKWSVDVSSKQIKNSRYSFYYDFYCVDNLVHLDAEYKNLQDYVSEPDTRDYLTDINAYYAASSYRLSSGGNDNASSSPAPASKESSNNILVILVIGAVITGVVLRMRRDNN